MNETQNDRTNGGDIVIYTANTPPPKLIGRGKQTENDYSVLHKLNIGDWFYLPDSCLKQRRRYYHAACKVSQKTGKKFGVRMTAKDRMYIVIRES